MSDLKEATILIATGIYVDCPNCGSSQSGFFGDPRGEDFECDECEKIYKIHSEADIEMR